GGFPSNRKDLPLSLVLPVGPRSCRARKLLASPAASGRGGANPRRSAGITGRAQEPGETGPQGSEPFGVPRQSGNSSREDPAEGRGGRVTDPRSGHRARTARLDPPVHATASDSGAGERSRDLTSRL